MRQIDCPHCGSHHTFPTPDTMWERFCANCLEYWDIRPAYEIEFE